MSNWSSTASSTYTTACWGCGQIRGTCVCQTYKNGICSACLAFPCSCSTSIPSTYTTTTSTTGTFGHPLTDVKFFDGLLNKRILYKHNSVIASAPEKVLRKITLSELVLPKLYGVHVISLGHERGFITQPIPLKFQYKTADGEKNTSYLLIYGPVTIFSDSYEVESGDYPEITDNFSIIKLLATTSQFRRERKRRIE